MLRSFLSWLLGTTATPAPPADEGTEREPAFLDFSTHGPTSRGRQKAEAMWERLGEATVPIVRPAKKGAFALDNADCNTGSAFGNLDEGQAVTDAQLAWFSSQGFIGYQMAGVLSQHWLINKACTVPARDAVRNWLEVSLTGAELDDEKKKELLETIDRLDGEYQIRQHAEEFIGMGRTFGIRLALFRVDLGSEQANKEYYENPFNPDAVKPGAYRGIRQVDQYWCSPQLDVVSGSDPSSPDFYEPTWWMIGGKRFHRSHFAIFRTGALPDNLKPYYLFGGVPLPQRIMERVYGAERAANEGPLLLMTKRKTVWKTDLEGAMKNPDKFLQHVKSVSDLANNFALQAIDTDDDVVVHDTALADVDTVIMGQFQLVAATANVPATKLLGTTPKGFQSTGEAEGKIYGQELETIQENDLTPLVNRHHQMLLLSDLKPEFKLSDDVTLAHAWEPTDSPSAKELAEINKLNAEADAALINAGVLDQGDARDRLRNDKNSGYEGIAADVPEDELEDEPLPEAETISEEV